MKAVELFLQESPERQRTLGMALQREIDAERTRADDPEIACAFIAAMLCRQLGFLGDEICNLNNEVSRLPRAEGLDSSTAH